MLTWWIKRKLKAFERQFDYDATYLLELFDADPSALRRIAKLDGISTYRRGVPVDAWFAAKLCGTMAEDCGPCTQLVVKMAERERVDPRTLRAIIERNLAEMPDDVALAYRYAEATLARGSEASPLRAQVERRWGRVGLLSLAFALVSARLYPTLKYALGHGQACTRVKVAGTTVSPVMPEKVA